MKVSKGKRLLILGILLVIIDQIIKVLVKTNMDLGETIDVIGDWFKLHFVLNKGMAFGMAFGGLWGKVLLSVFRIVLFGALCWWISSLAKKEQTPVGVLVGLTMITAGAFGNIIDCLFYGMIFNNPPAPIVADFVPFGTGYDTLVYGRVVDMFYFPIIDTNWPAWMPFVGGEHFIFFSPIFNFADAAISCGIIALLLFYGKDFNDAYHAAIKKS